MIASPPPMRKDATRVLRFDDKPSRSPSGQVARCHKAPHSVSRGRLASASSGISARVGAAASLADRLGAPATPLGIGHSCGRSSMEADKAGTLL